MTSRVIVRGSAISLFLYGAVYLLVSTIVPIEDNWRRTVEDVGRPVAASIASVLCLTASYYNPDPSRVAWRSMGLGCASWAIGGSMPAFYDYVLNREMPFPSLADVGYLGFLPFMLAGLLLMEPVQRRIYRLRTALDGMALVLTVGTAVWIVVLQGLYSDSSIGLLQKIVSGGYPLGDLVMMFALLLLLNRNRTRQATLVVSTLSMGLIAIVLADLGFAYSTVNNVDFIGVPIHFLRVTGFLLIGHSALLQFVWKPVTIRESVLVAVAPWRQALPLLLILISAFAEGVASKLGVSDWTLTTMSAAVLVIVIIRQAIVLRDNADLNIQLSDLKDTLEEKVKERTFDLEVALKARTTALEQVERLASILEATPDFVITADMTGEVVYLNSAARNYRSVSSGRGSHGKLPEWYPQDQRILFETEVIPAALSEGVWSGETKLITTDLTETPVSQVMVAHKNAQGRPRYLSVIARDITEQRLLEGQLRHQAFVDQLTGLANRVQFMNRLDQAMSRSSRTGELVAVLFIDLDHFKSVNDNHGHSAGDRLLREVAQRIERCLRPGDTASRLGGDEFAAVIDGIAEPQSATVIAERIVELLALPFDLDPPQQVFVSASVGVRLCRAGEDVDACLRDADIAMYSAKSAGRNRIELYADDSHLPMLEHMQILGELQRAVDHGEFLLLYQPTWSLATGNLHGVEALVRWDNPKRGLIGPNQFIPLAEQSGSILPLGRWVLRKACLQASVWQHRFPAARRLGISVNVSAKQLQVDQFVQEVVQILQDSFLEPGTLTLEITESAVMGEVERVIPLLQTLKEAGARLSIDDFGTGYSSLSYLQQLPVDELKIDKSFVDAIDSGKGRDLEITQTIVQIAKTLNLEIVAEGIERSEQAAFLRHLDCDRGQGFLYSHPLTAQEMQTLLGKLDWTMAA